jgi:putative FmdB family regulatory protein
MPLYDLKCQKCENQTTVFRKVDERDRLPWCACGGVFQRMVSAPAVQAGFSEYISPATGKLISSPGAQREDLRRSNCILHEPGLDRDVKRWGQESKEKAFAPISKGVDSVVTALVNSGKLES